MVSIFDIFNEVVFLVSVNGNGCGMLRVACGVQESITENFLKIINFSRVLADVADRLVEEGLREYQ